MTDTIFCVEGFTDNTTASPKFSAKTLGEAKAVFNTRVSRGDIEVTLWKVKGFNAELLKEINK